MLKKELWVGKKIGRLGGGGVKILILSTSTSIQIPNHNTSKKKKTEASNTVNIRQAIRQGKLRKITKCLVFITPGRFAFNVFFFEPEL